jgi:hypothetical protein
MSSQRPWEGPIICFPDGSLKALNKVLAEQGLL